MSVPGIAHDARPVFVQIIEQAPEQFEVQWKIPVSVPVYALPSPAMPGNCHPQGPEIRRHTGDAFTFHQSYVCQQRLSGNHISIQYPNNNPGLSTLIRVKLLNGEQHSQILKPDELRWQIPESESFLKISKQYTLFGFEHIFAGIDHLLFVACLVFIAGSVRRIIITISGFTLAHSLTLVLSALDLVKLPVPPVEAAIALSIVFLTHEIAVANKHSWTWRYPLLVSVSFGLLHGFGFASVLQDIGLPQTELAAGLLFFNIGVEIGQVLFIAAILGFSVFAGRIFNMGRASLLGHRYSITICSYTIGITASYWLVDRTVGF